jgi:transketolase
MLEMTRQNLPTLDRSMYAPAEGVRRGAYTLADLIPDGKRTPEVILMASGPEVGLIVEAGKQLAAGGVAVRLVSFPSWELFGEQRGAYQAEVLPPMIRTRVAVEAGVSQGWHRWVGSEGVMLGIDHYGASGPANTLFEKLGLAVNRVVETASHLVIAARSEDWKPRRPRR